MGFSLSLNANPLVNRFAEPEDLIAVLADEIGIGHIQLVHEFINPAWDTKTVARLTGRMAKACASKRVKITSLMTGPYGRLNHFAHPDGEVRDYYVRWFKGMADIAAISERRPWARSLEYSRTKTLMILCGAANSCRSRLTAGARSQCTRNHAV